MMKNIILIIFLTTAYEQIAHAQAWKEEKPNNPNFIKAIP